MLWLIGIAVLNSLGCETQSAVGLFESPLVHLQRVILRQRRCVRQSQAFLGSARMPATVFSKGGHTLWDMLRVGEAGQAPSLARIGPVLRDNSETGHLTGAHVTEDIGSFLCRSGHSS